MDGLTKEQRASWLGKQTVIKDKMNKSESSSSSNSNLDIKETIGDKSTPTSVPGPVPGPVPVSHFSDDSSSGGNTDQHINRFLDTFNSKIKDIKDRSKNVEGDMIHEYASCMTRQDVTAAHEKFYKTIKNDGAKYIEEIKHDGNEAKSKITNSESLSPQVKEKLKNKINEYTQKIIREEGKNIKSLLESNDWEFNNSGGRID